MVEIGINKGGCMDWLDNGNPSQDANKETTQQEQANTQPEGDQVPCNELPASVCSLGVCVVVKMESYDRMTAV